MSISLSYKMGLHGKARPRNILEERVEVMEYVALASASFAIFQAVAIIDPGSNFFANLGTFLGTMLFTLASAWFTRRKAKKMVETKTEEIRATADHALRTANSAYSNASEEAVKMAEKKTDRVTEVAVEKINGAKHQLKEFMKSVEEASGVDTVESLRGEIDRLHKEIETLKANK